MTLSRQDAERESIRRWLQLPPHNRRTCEDAEAYAARLAVDLDFFTVTSRQRLIAAWLIRELFRTEAENRLLAAEVPGAAEAA